VKETFDSIPFKDFVVRIEQQSNVHFFFKPEWVDSLFISNHLVPNTLQAILKENLQAGNITFLVYNCNTVIINKDYTFLEELPETIFEKNIASPPVEADYKESSFIKNARNNNKANNGIKTIGDPSKKFLSEFAKISGVIYDSLTRTPITGVLVFFDEFKSPVITDSIGYYAAKIKTGIHTIHFRCLGKIERKYKIAIYSNGTLNEYLKDDALSFQEVYVYANKEHNVRDGQLGTERIDVKLIHLIPSSMGETDILKMVLLLPGVQSVGESASGFNVRGGGVDQNLLLIDNSPIYNSFHLFGFFSAINAEMVQDFQLYKSSYPSYFGGRLSSVIDVNLRKGDPEKFSVKGEISPITGKLLIEGPLIKNKISFILSGRSTYSDWILKKINTRMMQHSEASFYDLNAKINYNVNKSNSLQFTGYYSYDYFKLNSDTSYNYENLNGSASWKHTFTDRLTFNLTGLFSEYKYRMESTINPLYAFGLNYDIQHFEGKTDFTYLPTDKHKIRVGASSIKYSLNPGTYKPGVNSLLYPVQLNSEQGVESALYLNDEYNLTDDLLINVGFRYSFFFSMGPSKVYQYSETAPRSKLSRIDSSFYGRNEITSKYGNPEIRLSARYQFSPNNSIKASYTRMTQYIHMITNTMAVSPTDVWALSNPNLRPQDSRQVSIGFYQNFRKNMFETSLELYYKKSENLLEYKPGAQLLLNNNLELDLLEGTGKAYGAELIIRKKLGKLNGWISYTYSRSLIQVNGPFLEEKINTGKYYPSNYDKPHDFTIVSNYRFSRRISLSGTLKYSTGHPITFPVGRYIIKGRELLHYSNRNEYRIPDYFRIDFALNIEGNLKLKKLAHSSWSFSIYNLTGRDNVYSIYFISDPNKRVKGYKLSVFTRPIPSITYNFKF
jgi:hypothetical protein